MSILRYANQGATRNLPVVPGLASNLEQAISAVYGPGAYLQVYSGGQPGRGEGGARTGSIRHDHGRAADIRVFGADGNQISGDGLAPLGQYWRANNFGGVGLEMHGGGIHLDDWTKPPPGGGMNWNYANQGGRYTDAMASAIAAGNKGVMPTLFGGETPSPTTMTAGATDAPYNAGDTPTMAYNAQPNPSPAFAAFDQQTTGSTQPASLPASLPSDEVEKKKGGLLGGILDFNNPQTLIALQLIMNGMKSPDHGFDGIPELALYKSKSEEANRLKKQEALQRNQTYQFMLRKAPEIAQAMLGGLPGPDAFNKYYDTYGKQNDPAYQLDMRYKQAQLDALNKKPQRNWQRFNDTTLFDPENGETKAIPVDPNAPVGDLGLNPQYGVDEAGNPVILQLGKNGRAVQAQLPDGVKFAKEPIKIDAGTHFVLLDPITRQPVGQIPKDVAGAEREKVAGKTQGEAAAALPGTESFADAMVKDIDELKNDKYLPNMLGWNDYLPNVTPDAARVQSKIEKLRGGSFLAAREWLKAQGPITDFESGRAEKAYARLNTAQTVEDFNDALDEAKLAVEAGVRKVRQAARGNGTLPAGADYKNRYGLE